jgi:hypothetical protein
VDQKKIHREAARNAKARVGKKVFSGAAGLEVAAVRLVYFLKAQH